MANIRLGSEGLPRTNGVAYFAPPSATMKTSLTTLAGIGTGGRLHHVGSARNSKHFGSHSNLDFLDGGK